MNQRGLMIVQGDGSSDDVIYDFATVGPVIHAHPVAGCDLLFEVFAQPEAHTNGKGAQLAR